MRQPGLSRRMLIGLVGTSMMAPPGRAETRSRYILTTGAAGGNFHEYGPVLAEVVAKHAPIDLDVLATAGSNDNIRALVAAEADLGLVNLGPAYRAHEGLGRFAADGPQRALRALVPMYEAPLGLIALRKTGIRSLSDLRGRQVGLGPAGSPGEMFFTGLVKALGLDVRAVKGAPGDLARKVIDGELDALWAGGSLPVPAFVQVLDAADAVVVGLGAAEVSTLRSAFPFVSPGMIPARTYRGQEAPLVTASVWNFVLCTDRLPDDAAYAITRTALTHAAELAGAVAAVSGTRAQSAIVNTFLPFHPGAVRYYRESGVTIPASLIAG